MDRTSLKNCLWALPSGDPADSKATQAGENCFTRLSLKNQAAEKKRDQCGAPPGKGTKGSGGKRDKGKCWLRSSRTLWGHRFNFTDSIHAPAPAVSLGSPVLVWGPLALCLMDNPRPWGGGYLSLPFQAGL